MSAEDLSHRLPDGDPPEAGDEGSGSIEGVPFPTAPRDEEIERIRDIEFPVALRGYDRDEVDAYVRRVNRLIAELEVSRSPQSAVRHALEQVGDQTRDILQQAHESAERITAESRVKAEDRVEQAEREAAELRRVADQTVHSLDADVEAIWQERQRLIEDTRRLADEILRVADDGAERFPAVPITDEQEALPDEAPGEEAGLEPDSDLLPEPEEDAEDAALPTLPEDHGDETLPIERQDPDRPA